MYGSKAAWCSSGGYSLVAGLQWASLPVSACSSSFLASSRAACSIASDARYFRSADCNASSPRSCVRRCITSRLALHGKSIFESRKKALHRSFCVPFAPLLSVGVIRAQRRFFHRQVSRQRVSTTTLPLAGDRIRLRISPCRVLNADANPEVEVEAEGDELPAEAKRWVESEEKTTAPQNLEQQQQRKKLQNRIVFGVGIGTGFLGVVLAGGWVFTLAFSWAIWVATGEYFELVRSKGNIASGMTPPPPVAAKVCAAICSLMPIMTLYYGGRVGVVVTTSAFGLATVLLLQKGPRFSQLTSAIFGLIYCGYLPSFWIKLRCGLAIPALNTGIAVGWPVLLGGQEHWTVGLVATIISCSAIAAADTFSFLGGKTFGKTPLIAVSPKKTLEGAAVGLSCTIAVTILLSKLLKWPSSTPSAAVLAVLVFVSSLFGDLTESMIKRDAGVKDSGQLIPGHGGILDRVDSYIFTGALVYSFVKIGLPLFGG